MRVLILDRWYDEFLNELYAGPHRPRGSYAEQWRALMSTAFGTADFYSRNLEALGHSATELIVNCLPLQKQWAEEYGGVPLALRLAGERGAVPGWASRFVEDIVIRQVRAYRPDVIHVQDPLRLSDRLCRVLHEESRLVIAQIASIYHSIEPLKRFDVVLSSLPNFVQAFKAAGIQTEYFRLGFETSLLERVHRDERYEVVFVGGVSALHDERIAALEYAASKLPMQWWGYGVEYLAPNSVLRACHKGAAWGLDAYAIIAGSAICLNRHGVTVAGRPPNYANNMRLYEATGVGTLLITDAKDNLHELFEPEREVVTYTSPEGLVERAEYYLAHDQERRQIASAGQKRTLTEHSYRARMEEFIEIVARYL